MDNQIFLPMVFRYARGFARERAALKREIRHFHVVVVQRRQSNVQKSVMHVQSCCFY